MTTRLMSILAVLVAASFALAACGSDDSSSTTAAEETTEAETTATETSTDAPAAGGATIAISADPGGELAFTETDLTGEAGSDTIEFDNPSTTAHNVYIEDADGNVVAETDTVTGDSTTATADLEAGTYTYYCDVDSHREAGMEGTLTVN